MGFNLLNISGGSTKIAGLLAKCEHVLLDVGYRPDVVTGVSAGAILALPIVLGKWDEMRETVLSVRPGDVFDSRPFNDAGKVSFRAAVRVMLGEGSLGTQANLEKQIRKLVTKTELVSYQRDTSLPQIIIGCTNYNTGKFKMFDVKKLSYEEYVKLTLASASIPIVVEAVKVHGAYWYDGGVCHHTCSVPYLTPSTRGVRNVVTIYSRPKEPDTSHNNFNMVDLSQVLTRTLDLMTDNVSLRDSEAEELICGSGEINLVQTFCPRILTSLYDMDHARLRELYDRCRHDPDEPDYKEVLG